MNFSHYSDLTAAMAVDLVNTLNPVSGDDRLTTLDEFHDFLADYREAWEIEDWGIDDVTTADLSKVRSLRDRLRAIFESEDDAEAATVINDILSDAHAIPRISVHDESPHFHFEPLESDVVLRLAAAAAMGLGTILVEYGLDRFGTCASSDCDDAYVDTSRNRSRLHCSTTCSTRSAVAAHRARKAAEKS